jgi:hypothetical protein
MKRSAMLDCGKTMRQTITASLLVLGLAPFVSCSREHPAPQPAKWDAEIARNKTLWSNAHISNYDLLIKWGGPTVGGYSGLVTVRSGAVVSVVDPATSEPLDPSQAKPIAMSVDRLFEVLSEANGKPRATLSATFDANLGYPKQFKINWNPDVTDAIESADIELRQTTDQ